MRQTELSVLGCLILDSSNADKVFSCLSASMFEDLNLAAIFSCCKELRKDSMAIDATTILSRLGNSFKAPIVEAAEAAPSLSGLDSYILCIQQEWRERVLREKMGELCLSGLDADGMVNELKKMLALQQRVVDNQLSNGLLDMTGMTVSLLSWYGKQNTNIKTGWGNFDRLTGGLARKGVTGISARPGCGKTAFALQLATMCSREHRVLYHSLEMPSEQITMRIYSRALNLDSSLIRDRELTQDQLDDLAHVSDVLSSSFDLKLCDSTNVSLADLEANVARVSPDILVVDHIGLLIPDGKKKQRNEELADITRGLKQLAMRYNIAVIELIQASRNAEGKALTMADMFGSATIEHDADMLIGIQPETGQYRRVNTKINVLKNRHGGIGSIEFCWDKPVHSFSEVEYRHE